MPSAAGRRSTRRRGENLRPLFELLLERVPAPTYDPSHPLQAQVTNLDASPYLGRLAICRVRHGTIARGQRIGWCRADGSVQAATVGELFVTRALERVPAKAQDLATSSPSPGSTT